MQGRQEAQRRTPCVPTMYTAFPIGQEEKGGNVAIRRKLRDKHFLVLLGMLISKIDDGAYRSAVKCNFLALFSL